ncbi:MAG: ABC transporter ATP-binding protein [Thermodesulfobacteriota bacterium]
MTEESLGTEPVLSLRSLTTVFKTDLGLVRAVDGLDLDVYPGSTLGLVGESGCGKSTVGLSIMGLVPKPPGEVVAGEIFFQGTDMRKLSNKDMRRIRGNKISMIFQEPMTSLNPVLKVGRIMSEVIALHQKTSRKEAWQRSIEALDKVRIPSPELRINDYPHEMSGGMRQRVMIALAISSQPDLIIADEPTTALDVTIQAQILSLLNQIKKDLNTSIILVTHNLGVIAENAQQVAVMYAGRLVEYAATGKLFDQPLHPYTAGLLLSAPRLGSKAQGRLKVIPGAVPNLLDPPPGCRFAERCEQAMGQCRTADPKLVAPESDHLVRCWKFS